VTILLSIIIPVLNEEAHMVEQVSNLLPAFDGEVIVVDGGSRDRTVELARAFTGVRVIEFNQAQRAAQMNAGAAAARGEVLLFLHADVRLPKNFAALIAAALRDERVVGGCFAFGFPPEVARAFRVYAWGVNWRTQFFTTATGDQALWTRRDVFNALGGFEPIPLMEDIALCHALKRRGRFVVLPEPVVISPRRWLTHGLVRTGLLMYALRFGYWLGVAPATLKRWFLDVR
jgi:rSAM/selenodomain-associated transferase 2